jgi:competence protein ComEC
LALVVLLDPWAVNAPGFYLSFGAVAVMAYALGGGIAKQTWFRTAVKAQWAVTIGMVPAVLILFNQTSLISPIANAVAIPLISFVVTPLALLGSFFFMDWPLHLAYASLEFCMAMLNSMNRLPFATWQQHAPASWTILPALLGMVWLLLPAGFPMRYLGLLTLLPMLLVLPERPLPGEMKVTVLDVGQGLSVVVQTAKHSLVFDAGPKYDSQTDAGSRIVFPYLRGAGVAKLDGLVISHNDVDHSGGMQSLLALLPVTWLASSLPKDAVGLVGQRQLRCHAGQTWVWDGVRFDMLYPSLASYQDEAIEDNNRSCVLKISSLAGALLLTGDIEKTDEHALLNSLPAALTSDVLVAPHHGSRTSSSQEFIEAVAPTVAVFTSGYLNRYRHPSSEVWQRYEAHGVHVYRSDFAGAIEMRFVRGGEEHPPSIHLLPWRQQYPRYWHDIY